MNRDDERRRPTSIQPLYDSLCIEFARRDLTDERLAEVVEGWADR